QSPGQDSNTEDLIQGNEAKSQDYTATIATNAPTTITGASKRKAGENTSVVPKKKVRTKKSTNKAPTSQLAVPQCEARYSPGVEQ
ncbi:hypothetical protein F53441_8830, partial [Fusarium austroafricanum]